MASDRTPYHKVGICAFVYFVHNHHSFIVFSHIQACLKCCECARKLDVMSLNEHDKLLYCCVCYQALFQAQVKEVERRKRMEQEQMDMESGEMMESFYVRVRSW